MDTYHVAKDGYGEEALWRGEPGADDVQGVAYRYTLDQVDPILWPTLVAVLCPDDATIDRMATAVDDLLAPYAGRLSGNQARSAARAVLRVATTPGSTR